MHHLKDSMFVWAVREPGARPGIQRCTTWRIRNLRSGRVAVCEATWITWPCLALLGQAAFECTSIGPSDECDKFCFVSQPLLSKIFGKDQNITRTMMKKVKCPWWWFGNDYSSRGEVYNLNCHPGWKGFWQPSSIWAAKSALSGGILLVFGDDDSVYLCRGRSEVSRCWICYNSFRVWLICFRRSAWIYLGSRHIYVWCIFLMCDTHSPLYSIQ